MALVIVFKWDCTHTEQTTTIMQAHSKLLFPFTITCFLLLPLLIREISNDKLPQYMLEKTFTFHDNTALDAPRPEKID